MLCRMRFDLLDSETLHALDAQVADGRVGLLPGDVERALGWKLEPRGLCRGSVCIPVREREALVRGGRIDLETLAALLGRPLALDADEALAALAESPEQRAELLDRGIAPDFSLPDLSGRQHSLAQQRGRKVLLIAYASW